MAKTKKLAEKLRQYYKGSASRPVRRATQDEMAIISEALLDCLPNRTKASFKCTLNDKDEQLKLVVGLSASLRLLRRKQVRALILCSSAASHLTNLLTGFTQKLDLPMIVAEKLIDLAPKIGLNTLLLVSLVDANPSDNYVYKDGDPKPKSVELRLQSESFERFVNVLFSPAPQRQATNQSKFRLPDIIHKKSGNK